MKRLMLMAVLLAGVIGPGPVCSQNGCGMKPMKPMTPMGCKDLVAQCSCVKDKDGMLQCQWTWMCVK
jgi:hypothetical protein